MVRDRWAVSILIALCVLRPSVADAADPAPKGGRPPAAQSAAASVRVLDRVEGKYGQLEVLEVGGRRILACDGVIQSALPAPGLPLVPATLLRGRDYVGLIPYYRPRTRTLLVIGLGAGLHARALAAYGCKVHSVDIEPAVVPLARKHFAFQGEVTVADGRAFLEKTGHRYDAIVLDAFLGAEIPEHLYTEEAFRRMAGRLEHGGVLAVHLIARPRHAATKAVMRTLGEVFPHTVAAGSGFGQGLQHIYLLASRRPLELQSETRRELDRYGFTGDELFTVDTTGAPLLTDGRTNLTELCRQLAAEHRRNSLKLLGRFP